MSDTTVQTAPARRGRPPKAASAQRAPQRGAQQRRTRTGRMEFSDDIYAVDRSILPDHMDYQWVTKSVMGDETGKVRADFTRFTMNGWEPVDAKLLPQYGLDAGEINIGGQVLMQRPIEMSEEARQEEQDKARNQVMQQIQRLDDDGGNLPRRDRAGNSLVSLRRDEPIPVRSDEDYEAA